MFLLIGSKSGTYMGRNLMQIIGRVEIRAKYDLFFFKLVGFMVFNVTFNNISVISWQSVLLVEETGVPAENNRPATTH